jgi:hypothetical protein
MTALTTKEGHEAVSLEARDQGLVAPLAKRRFAFESLAFAKESAQSGKFGVGGGLVQEDQSWLQLTHDGRTVLETHSTRALATSCQSCSLARRLFYSHHHNLLREGSYESRFN